jgi:hypothetical protein
LRATQRPTAQSNTGRPQTREGQGAGKHQIGFEGGRVNIDTKMRVGARRIAISFGDGYRTC